MEELIKKTAYEWCLEANIRVLKIVSWPTIYPTGEQAYFEEKITLSDFYARLEFCTVKPNSQPRKTDKYLEYRMYGLVPYNISPIQQAIQYGHAVVDYGMNVSSWTYGFATGVFSLVDRHEKWARVDKTFIILNGGTTNNNPERLGTLNKHLITLREAGVMVQDFYEPDLGDQLTAVVFLIDERVFNKTLYPSFIPEVLPYSPKKPSEKALSQLEARNAENYALWVEKIGGATNAFLREFLQPFKLA